MLEAVAEHVLAPLVHLGEQDRLNACELEAAIHPADAGESRDAAHDRVGDRHVAALEGAAGREADAVGEVGVDERRLLCLPGAGASGVERAALLAGLRPHSAEGTAAKASQRARSTASSCSRWSISAAIVTRIAARSAHFEGSA